MTYYWHDILNIKAMFKVSLVDKKLLNQVTLNDQMTTLFTSTN